MKELQKGDKVTEHTATPWKYARLFKENAPESFAIVTGKWGAPLIADCPKEEDAAFIVSVANAYREVSRRAERAEANLMAMHEQAIAFCKQFVKETLANPEIK